MPHESLHLGMFPLAAHYECWEICGLWFPAESGTGNDEYQQKISQSLKIDQNPAVPKSLWKYCPHLHNLGSLGILQVTVLHNNKHSKKKKHKTHFKPTTVQKFGDSLFYYTFIFIFLKNLLILQKSFHIILLLNK